MAGTKALLSVTFGAGYPWMMFEPDHLMQSGMRKSGHWFSARIPL
jgi:hypothetical protein